MTWMRLTMRPESRKMIPTGTMTSTAGHAINIPHQACNMQCQRSDGAKKRRKRSEIKHEKQNMRFVFEGDTDFDAVAWSGMGGRLSSLLPAFLYFSSQIITFSQYKASSLSLPLSLSLSLCT